MPRVSVEVGYYRRWWPIYDGADVTDNIAVSAAEYGQFSVTAPIDPRLPNGGGYTVDDLYNITPAAAARAVRERPQRGQLVRRLQALLGRLRHHVPGATGQRPEHPGRHQHRTAVRGLLRDHGRAVPELSSGRTPSSLTNPYCRQVEPLLTTYKANASYLVPKVDVQVSGTFSSRPGAVLQAQRRSTRPNDPTIVATLGRPLAAVAERHRER